MSFADRLGLIALVAHAGVLGCSAAEDARSVDPLADSGTAGTGPGVPDGASAKPVYASFVAESEVGKGPAALRFFNDTPETLSYYLGPVDFWLIGPYSTSEAKVVASADVLADSQLLYHTEENLCYQIKLDEIAGPSALGPATGYTLHVTKTPDKQIYQVELLEDAEPPSPFIALRAQLPTASSLNAIAELELGFDGRAAPASFAVIGVMATPYDVFHAESLEVRSVHFEDRSAKVYSFTGMIPLTVQAASGFTVVVDANPVAGAETITLDPIP